MFQIHDWEKKAFSDGEFVAQEELEFTSNDLAHEELRRLKLAGELSPKAIVVLVPGEGGSSLN